MAIYVTPSTPSLLHPEYLFALAADLERVARSISSRRGDEYPEPEEWAAHESFRRASGALHDAACRMTQYMSRTAKPDELPLADFQKVTEADVLWLKDYLGDTYNSDFLSAYQRELIGPLPEDIAEWCDLQLDDLDEGDDDEEDDEDEGSDNGAVRCDRCGCTMYGFIPSVPFEMPLCDSCHNYIAEKYGRDQV